MAPPGPENTGLPGEWHALENPLEPQQTAEQAVAAERDSRVGGLSTSPAPEQTPSGGRLVGEQWSAGALPRENRLLAPLPPESYERLRYERLREKLRDAFPGVEYDADLERMAEQFVVELGWLQERTFPLEVAHPRARLSAHDLLELADSFYRYRVERWAQGEARSIRAFGAGASPSPLPN